MQPQNNSLAIVSLILGILGLIGFLPLIGNLLGIILGHIARHQIAGDDQQRGDGMALVGMISGYIGLVLVCSGIIVVTMFYGGSLFAFLGNMGS